MVILASEAPTMKMITSNQSPTLELPRAVNRSPSKMISGTNTTMPKRKLGLRNR